MDDQDLKRWSAVAGAVMFLLALGVLLMMTGPGKALLGGLGLGLATGLTFHVVGYMVLLGRAPTAVAPEPAPEEAAPNLSPDETQQLDFGDIAKAADLHQTVRIAPGSLDFVVPELKPEEVLQQREGIDMDALQQIQKGIEAKAAASENTTAPGGGAPQP